MKQKPGRNDPCPCGSGKKYKKCCGLNQSFEPIIPKALSTGTPYDDYLKAFSFLAMGGRRIIEHEGDGRELKKAASDFEMQFRPGKPGGLTDSLFMSWMNLDLRFGRSRETIAERFLRDPLASSLPEPGLNLIKDLASSCLTFHEIIKAEGETAVFEELGTGMRRTVRHINELYEMNPLPGEIWLARLVGPPDDALCYTTPYVYDPESKAQFRKAVRIQAKDFSSGPRASRFPPERHFAESQKEAALFWAEFVYSGLNDSPAVPGWVSERVEVEDIPKGALPFMVNTDGDEIVFAEMIFRVKDEPALRKRLAGLKSFSYDEKLDSWTWLKKASQGDPDVSRTIRGSFQVKDGFLTAETNSRERTAWLKIKLKSLLGDLISYDGTRWRDQDDFPERSPEEKEAFRKESDELNALPEIKEALGKYYEHHYFKKWPTEKVPALGGLTPVQASKTETGREKLKALIDYFDKLQDANPPSRARFDFDRLRRMFGLPPKAN